MKEATVIVFVLGALAFGFIGLCFVSFFSYVKTGRDLTREVNKLAVNRTDAGAIEFANFVAKMAIINQPQFYNQLRAAWGIVRDARTISKSVKEQVKLTMQARGVILR